MENTQYETIIGLETHIQLLTASKAFCADAVQFGSAPNTHTGAVSLAHPGTLPRFNRKALEYAVRLGLALDCEINRFSAFDRKNYFYADLPKGFQTTQDKYPICLGGTVRIATENGEKRISLHHIHIEEDAGKSIHDLDPKASLVDLNRAGIPLLEVVSNPDLRSGAEVAAYMEALRRLVRRLGISDGNMEEGSFRCDVNVSVRKKGETGFNPRCEIKNMNSMRFARKAVDFEAARQIQLMEAGEAVVQETRGFDPESGRTFSLRDKEDAHDYRYFPEPDLPPMILSEEYILQIKSEMPELPWEVETALRDRYGLPAGDVAVLANEKTVSDYFFELVGYGEQLGESPGAKPLANFMIQRILPWCAEAGLEPFEYPLKPDKIYALVSLVESGKVNALSAWQRLLPALLQAPETDPPAAAEKLQLIQSSDGDFILSLIDEVLRKYPDKVAEYRKGKKGLLGMFMGELMKLSKGKADPKTATGLLEERLKGGN